MNAKQLREKLQKLRQERKELFKKMTDGYKAEDLAAYEAKAKEIMDVEHALTEAERIEMEDRLDPTGQDALNEGNRQTMTDEESRFIQSLREAVAVGSTYTGLIPSTIASEIVKLRETYGKLRGRCRRISLAGDYTIAVDGDGIMAEYVGEGGKIGEKTPELRQVKFSAFKLAVLVKVSEEFVADVGLDVIAWLTETIARAFARKEDLEILKGTGSGNGHITGILTAVDSNAIVTEEEDALTLDDVKRLVGALGGYGDGAVLIMNGKTKTELSLLKDQKGQYYFPPNLPLTSIDGKEIIQVDSMDDLGAGKRPIIAANLNYYQLVDRKDLTLTVLNELYAENDQKGIRGVQRVDGNVLVPDAFKVLGCKAATEPEGD